MFCILSAPVKAQNISSLSNFNNHHQIVGVDSIDQNNLLSNKKWTINKFIGINNSMSFFRGGNASIFSVPIGLQINRRLSNNWYAFAAIAATPGYINFNNTFLSGSANKFSQSNNRFQSNSFNVNPSATLGLMYTNDQKTFSISGSINIERNNYFFAPSNQLGATRPSSFNQSKVFGMQ